jgi:hypothetical protein
MSRDLEFSRVFTRKGKPFERLPLPQILLELHGLLVLPYMALAKVDCLGASVVPASSRVFASVVRWVARQRLNHAVAAKHERDYRLCVGGREDYCMWARAWS